MDVQHGSKKDSPILLEVSNMTNTCLRKLTTFICIALLCIFGVAQVAQAKVAVNIWNLMDSGEHLDYTNNSKYVVSVTTAVGWWNAYKKGVIRKDTSKTVNDVTMSHYSKKDGSIAITSPSGTLKFNSYYMSSLSEHNRIEVAAHEIGHALGLSHNSSKTDIMHATSLDGDKLSKNDKESYDYAYWCNQVGRM
ncbi:MAG: matrixin family metalloprotease [Actinomycetes bacterium]|jgi:hypothetical protein|nr:matrixin family metalloprotease [Actinomycetes bacterium]